MHLHNALQILQLAYLPFLIWGGANGRIANLYARATSAYMKRKQAALGAVSG